MIVKQLIDVLPAGTRFEIFDLHKKVLAGRISMYDKSLLFDGVTGAEKYEKVYSLFHVELVNCYIDERFELPGDTTYVINVR